MFEEFDENVLKGACPGRGSEEGSDPAVIGAEAAAGSFGGGVEATEFAVGSDLCNEFLVFGDAEGGVPAVRGVGEGLEEGAASTHCCVGGLEELPETTEIGEGLELAGAEKFDVPGVDAGIGEAGFGVGAVMKFGVLFDRGFEVGAFLALGALDHPVFDRGGGNEGDSVLFGGFEAEEKLIDDCRFVVGVHGIGTADHEHEIEREVEVLEAVGEFVEISFGGARDDG